MLNITRTPRNTTFVIVLITLLVVVVGALTVTIGSDAIKKSSEESLAATAFSGAAFLPLSERISSQTLTRGLSTLAEQREVAGIAVVNQLGELVAASAFAEMEQVNWSVLLHAERPVSGVSEAEWGGEKYYVAVSQGDQEYVVAAVQSAVQMNTAQAAFARMSLLIFGVCWLLAVCAAFMLLYILDRRKEETVISATEQLLALKGTNEGASKQVLRSLREELGRLHDPLVEVDQVLQQQHARNQEIRGHVAALFQINPHYALICTLDGHIVDANPAFYAMTGLPFEVIRGNRIEVLNEVMPIEPLFDLARRSLREGASISGVEYSLVNRDDMRLAVQVSLRAVTVEGKPGVVIQATDVAQQRKLERQISTFSDALDLMVDQRVAQLTVGNTSLSSLLDNAGILMAAFDPAGGVRRWNRVAEELTGRRMTQIPHFLSLLGLLGLEGNDKEAFKTWFWGSSEGGFPMEIQDATGLQRRILWRKSLSTEPGKAENRVLLGMEMPRMQFYGDGLGSEIPPVVESAHHSENAQ